MSTQVTTLSEKLGEAINNSLFSVLQTLRNLDEKKAKLKPQPEKWSHIETLGHLTDSAINNQQRIVRAMLEPHTEAKGYKQNDWVNAVNYRTFDWKMLLSVWMNLNYLLASTVQEIPEAALSHTISIDGNAPITLQFLIEDYNAHLQNHLKQIIPNASFNHLL